MQRTFLPNILASLGLVLILWTRVMPLFEWEIRAITNDFPPTYEVRLAPSPWIIKFGETLDDKSYSFKKVQVLFDKAMCTNDEEFLTIQRSPNERSLEAISLTVNKATSWLILWSFIQVLLSGVYIWWLIVWQGHRPISSAVIPIVASAAFFCLLIAVLRLVDPMLSVQYAMIPDQCQGALTLDARLSKIHYEMPLTLFFGGLAEVIALGMMLRQLIMAIIHKKESPESAVGYRLTALSRGEQPEDQKEKKK